MDNEQKEKLLKIKQKLLTKNDNEFEKFYQNYENYAELLDTTNNLLGADDMLFAIDSDIRERVVDLINYQRFSRKGNTAKINEVIAKINRLEATSQIDRYNYEALYLAFHNFTRQSKFENLQELENAMYYDYTVLNNIKTGNFDEVNPKYVLGNLRYLSIFLPDVIKDRNNAENIMKHFELVEDNPQNKVLKFDRR